MAHLLFQTRFSSRVTFQNRERSRLWAVSTRLTFLFQLLLVSIGVQGCKLSSRNQFSEKFVYLRMFGWSIALQGFVFFVFRPTPEEAKKWQTSFESMLKNKFGVQLFQDFLRSQYGEENLNFWLAVEEYKKVDEEGRAERARMIYEDYVSTLSPTEVSDNFTEERLKFVTKIENFTKVSKLTGLRTAVWMESTTPQCEVCFHSVSRDINGKTRNCFIALSPRNYCTRRHVNTTRSMRFEQRRQAKLSFLSEWQAKKGTSPKQEEILLVKKKKWRFLFLLPPDTDKPGCKG